MWIVDEAKGAASPINRKQAFSLMAAEAQGDVALKSVDDALMGLSNLRQLILAERSSPAVDIAGYDLWPWEQIYREEVEKDNQLSEEELHPSE